MAEQPVLLPVETFGNGSGDDLGPPLQIEPIRRFLKKNFDGPEVVEALRRRTMIQWLDPTQDPLSNQILGSYEKVAEILNIPSNFKMLDVGCMCGLLKHYLDQRIRYPFHYFGIDKWAEAIQVAKEFLPNDTFSVRAFEDEERSYDYVVMLNILLTENLTKTFEKAINLSRKAFLFGIPVHGKKLTPAGIARTQRIIAVLHACADVMGKEIEQFECGESLLIKVTHGNNNLR